MVNPVRRGDGTEPGGDTYRAICTLRSHHFRVERAPIRPHIEGGFHLVNGAVMSSEALVVVARVIERLQCRDQAAERA